MRAAVLMKAGEGLHLFDDVEIDDPRDDEVRVRIRHCGVCHSDLSVADGSVPFPLPAVLGHEASGEVEAIGSKVTSVAIGDRVVLSMRPPCGHCHWCVRDQPVLCAKTSGPPGSNPPRLWHRGRPMARGFRLGAFAEYVLADSSGVVKVPDGVSLESASVVGCAVQTGIGSVINVARSQPGARAAVLGLGGVGLAIVKGLALSGALTVIGVDPVEERRARALKMGATAVSSPDEESLRLLVQELTQGIGCDHVYDTVSTTATTRSAGALLRPGGSLVLIGVTGQPQPLGMSTMDIVMRQKSVVGSFLGNCHAERDLPNYLNLCRTGRLVIDDLVTSVRPLSEINAAFDDLRDGKGVRTVLTL